jgi:nucleoside-diphosphate-sugar epimerase
MAKKLHVVFGTGPLGRSVMWELLKRGKKVRMVNRSGRMTDLPVGVEVVAANVYDPAQSRAAADGAVVVYNCVAPAYSGAAWETDLPRMWRNILEAAKETGARLVIGDNLYMYDQAAGPIREDRPMCATTRKGRARAKAVEAMLQAHREGRVRVTFGRGSDFFGPYATDQSHLGSRVFPALLEGQPVSLIGDIDLPHTLTYIEDFGKALVILGQRDEAFGQVWHVPNAPTQTKREVLELAAKLAAKPLKIQTLRGFALGAASLFVPVLREVREMLYQFERPYLVDSSKFVQAFGDFHTPMEEALRRTLGWYGQLTSRAKPPQEAV